MKNVCKYFLFYIFIVEKNYIADWYLVCCFGLVAESCYLSSFTMLSGDILHYGLFLIKKNLTSLD